MDIQAARLYSIGVHEASHAVAGHVLGLIVAGLEYGVNGGTCHFGPRVIDTPTEARRGAIIMWSGEVGQQMLVPRRVAALAGASDHGIVDGDRTILMDLSMTWGQPDPVAWCKAAKVRATALLAVHLGVLRATALAVWHGQDIHMTHEPLLWVKPDDRYARPFTQD